MRPFKNFLVRAVAFAICLFCASICSAQLAPPAWSSTASYSAGDIVQYGGNWYRAVSALNAGGPYPAAAYDKWELNYVRSNTTLTIGDEQGFANLVYAWQFARNARIADAAYLHFSIITNGGNFSESFTGQFSLDHSSGALISIIGDNASNISLTFPSSNGFWLDNGHSIASISGLTISGYLNKKTSTGVGIGVIESASIAEVSNTTIENFATGAYAYANANLYLDTTVTVAECQYFVRADQSAAIECNFITTGASNTNLVAVLYADHNSTIGAEQATIQGNSGKVGFAAEAVNGAQVDLDLAHVESFSVGAAANFGGRVYATAAIFSNDSSYDLQAAHAGTIDASGAELNTIGTGSNDGSYVYH